jgi:uncharacterized RDD family membrane protein YckC
VIIVLVLIVAIPLAAVAGTRNDQTLSAPEGALVAIIVLIVFAVTIGYFPWFWARTGSTPGMRMMGLRVVRDADGGPLSVGQSLLRLLGYWVSSAIFYLGFIWVLFDKRRRGWHDLISGTVVVKKV